MRSLLSSFFFSVSSVSLVLAACDPELHIVNTPGAPEGGASEGAAVVPPPQTDGAIDTDGGDAEAGPDGATTHVIDGMNDFTAGEMLPTTSSGYYAYVSWDAQNVYFGMSGSDVGSGSGAKWVLVYVDGNPGNAGTTSGIAYDCSGTCLAQHATLPFSAGFHIRWKADGSYTNLQKWSGSAWVPVGPISTVAHAGSFMELSITRAALGSPSRLKAHVNMLIEQAGHEWTYAGAPSSSFTDGLNAGPFAKYFDFDLNDFSTAPNTYPTKP